MTRITLYVALGALAAAGLSAEPARAQTAYEINRLNQAVQICNSPMGAGLAECAQLRARLGMAGGGGAPGGGGLGLGGGKAAAAAGIAGVLSLALGAGRSQPAAAPPPASASPVHPAVPASAQPSPPSNPFGTLLPRR
ncbi:hypothetical protein [Phenylobacterium sp. CCH9-H3]|uniref:hypothetical protein n=2 Tax=unclassified Phenylobacterium TaxID=2640670 RepID=UPI00083B906E|nr:hypothetical protein [Phenylobacterium sp. CCH9-H3]